MKVWLNLISSLICFFSSPLGDDLLYQMFSNLKVKILASQNIYWADSGDLVTIASDSSFYILKYNQDVVSSYFDSGRPVDEQGVEDAFELHEINERIRTGLWVGDFFIYNNSSWRLSYCVGGEVTTMFHLEDRYVSIPKQVNSRKHMILKGSMYCIGCHSCDPFRKKESIFQENHTLTKICLSSWKCSQVPESEQRLCCQKFNFWK